MGEASKPSLMAALKTDGPSGLVVFLVALPLCLGIALGSGAPLYSGIIAGVIGGIVVTLFSDSNVSVSGPAAGLVVLTVGAIQTIGSYRGFLAAVVIAGIIQLILSVLKAGVIGDYAPNAVIKGMLAAIGLQIILKQIPHALGRDLDFMGDFNFLLPGSGNTFTELAGGILHLLGGALVISVASLALLIGWEALGKRGIGFFKLVPGPLVAILLGIGLNEAFRTMSPGLFLSDPRHMVNLPVARSVQDFLGQFTLPDFSVIGNPKTWTIGFTLAIVASLETLLSLEAADKLDPYKRISSPNRELLAQGIGNTLSGLLGGLPVTSVVVRTSANVSAGGRTKLSSLVHGILLLLATLFLAPILNRTPLACLAAVLITVGYKLTKPKFYADMFKLGMSQFIPFVVTIVAILFTGLLEGVLIGLACGVFFVVRSNHHNAVTVVSHDDTYLLRMNKDVTFLNKNELRTKLRAIPPNSEVLIDGSRALYVDTDIAETVSDFQQLAKNRNIKLTLARLTGKK